MRNHFDRLLLELSRQRSYEVSVMDRPGGKKQKKTGHSLYRPSRAMAEAEELLMELTKKQAARGKCNRGGCNNLADKGLCWADGRAVVLCCAQHEQWARDTIEQRNGDEVGEVWDLVKERRAQGL